MKTFQEFIKQLQETPQLNHYFSGDMLNNNLKLDNVKHIKSDSYNIGDNSFYYKNGDNHVYFHLDHKGDPAEVNYINKDNIQTHVSKQSGSSKYNINHMIHHIKKFGELKTSGSQSPGGKNLWINFIKSNPKNIKFECGGQELDHTNIDHHAFDLWNTNIRNSDKIIRAYYVNT